MRTITREFTDEMARRLRSVRLGRGSHDTPVARTPDPDGFGGKGVCVMEAIALITGQRHTADPICVSQVIGSFLIDVNDSLESVRERNKLKRVIPEVIGTRPVTSERDAGHERGLTVYEHGGYRYAERRRDDLLADELRDLGKEYTEEVTADEAIAIVRKLAAVPNRARR